MKSTSENQCDKTPIGKRIESSVWHDRWRCVSCSNARDAAPPSSCRDARPASSNVLSVCNSNGSGSQSRAHGHPSASGAAGVGLAASAADWQEAAAAQIARFDDLTLCPGSELLSSTERQVSDRFRKDDTICNILAWNFIIRWSGWFFWDFFVSVTNTLLCYHLYLLNSKRTNINSFYHRLCDSICFHVDYILNLLSEINLEMIVVASRWWDYWNGTIIDLWEKKHFRSQIEMKKKLHWSRLFL